MKLEFYPVEKLKKEVAEIIFRHLDRNTYHVLFFGSRVSGKSHERSDIDVGIEGPGKIPSDVFLQIKEEIENLPTLYTIDVVDFRRVAPSFREIALLEHESI